MWLSLPGITLLILFFPLLPLLILRTSDSMTLPPKQPIYIDFPQPHSSLQPYYPFSLYSVSFLHSTYQYGYLLMYLVTYLYPTGLWTPLRGSETLPVLFTIHKEFPGDLKHLQKNTDWMSEWLTNLFLWCHDHMSNIFSQISNSFHLPIRWNPKCLVRFFRIPLKYLNFSECVTCFPVCLHICFSV